ncbi:MAG: zinc ribbon domain-containing protein [Candidatus Omnitrophota bacterium]|nr:zinc ribbon domain-containing protein [Candidatus Omnitrophota bacterium]
MPTYEYECTKCGHSFEAFQKITDNHLDKCPECGGKVKRLISSGVGFIFKPECPKANEGCKGCPQAG